MTEPERATTPDEPEPSDEARRAIEHEQTDAGKEAPDDLGGTGGDQSGGAG